MLSDTRSGNVRLALLAPRVIRKIQLPVALPWGFCVLRACGRSGIADIREVFFYGKIAKIHKPVQTSFL